MRQARRALLVLISVVAVVAGFMPAAFAGPGRAVAAPSTAHATAVRGDARKAPAPAAAASQSLGYWLVAADGGVFSGGNAVFHGSTGAIHLARPIVGIASTPSGHGYWSVASDGGIFAFGDATFRGSTGGMHLNQPIVGIAATPSGRGYWLVASDGGIFAFGDAAFHGSTGAIHLNKPIVGIASTPSGHGYWLVASDGGIFAFGDATFHGSTGGMHLNRPIVGIGTSPSGHGYRMVASDGGVFSFGDAAFYGSTGAIHLNKPIVGMAPTASGRGYWFVASDGGVFSFGDAGFFGSTGAMTLTSPIVGMVATAAPALPLATHLAFTTQPGDSTGGLNLSVQPVVTVLDSHGDRVTADASAVTLGITGLSGASFTCTSDPQRAVAGVATFAGCAIDLASTYTLTATDGALASAQSAALTVAVGIPAKLHFGTMPSGAIFSVAFGSQPTLQVQDAGGNLATAGSSTVTLALTTPAGGVLACTTANTRTTSSGVATFAGCNINLAGEYTLTATDPGLTPAVSSNVEITTAATKLAFTTQPSATPSGGAPFAAQPVVKIQDASGRTVVADTSIVILAKSGTGTGSLTCDNLSATPVAGVATFSGCAIDIAGPYTVTATDNALTPAISNAVNVVPGAAAALVFTTQPLGSSGGLAFANQPAVTVEDLGGNAVPTANNVVLTLTTPTGAALACTGGNTKATTGSTGIATFVGCAINLASTRTLTATLGSHSVVSSGVVTAVGPASHIAFTTAPGAAATGGVAFVPQPAVTVEDAGGNAVAAANTITLSLATPVSGAALTCPGANAQATAGATGVATFAGCSINQASVTPYTLSAIATTGGFTATSGGITVSTGVATHLVFSTVPVGSTGGLVFGIEPAVTVEDAGGNPVVAANIITLSLTTAGSETLTCSPGSNAQPTAAGVATFVGCSINLASGHTLTATDTNSGFTVASATVTTAVGPLAQLSITTSNSATGGTIFGVQPQVTELDAGGNVVTTANTITLTLTGGAVGAALTCNPGTNAQATAGATGVATFVGCSIDKASTTTYTLTATSSPGGFTVPGPVVVSVGGAAKVGFTTQPGDATGGVAFAQPVIAVQDAGGNTVTTVAPTAVVLSITGAPVGPTLTCNGGNSVNTLNGVATFAGCKIDRAGSYTLTATASGLTIAASVAHPIVTVGAAVALVFAIQPVGSTAGTDFFTQPHVAIVDLGGNTVTSDVSDVSLAITGAPVGPVLTCALNPQTAAAGIATFGGCQISVAGGYTLTASDPSEPGLGTIASAALTITT